MSMSKRQQLCLGLFIIHSMALLRPMYALIPMREKLVYVVEAIFYVKAKLLLIRDSYYRRQPNVYVGQLLVGVFTHNPFMPFYSNLIYFDIQK